MVAASSAMQEVVTKLQRAARIELFSVLITGPTGSGKREAADYLHKVSEHLHGRQKNLPFVLVNCAALPDTLLEAELFGYERGAFTGAVSTKIGQFEVAARGTIFLDEIGHASPRVQKCLLHYLDSGEFTRLGGTRTIRIPARVVTATNKSLTDQIARGEFIEDLYWRLNTYVIEIPPLKDRLDDVDLLVSHCINQFNRAWKTSIESEVHPQALAELKRRRWPGNVRQLFNAVERAMVNKEGHGQLELADFDFLLREDMKSCQQEPEFGKDTDLELSGSRTLPQSSRPNRIRKLDEVQRVEIISALRVCGGRHSKAARLLGISKGTFHHLFNRLEIGQIVEDTEYINLEEQMRGIERETIVKALLRCGGVQAQAGKMLGLTERQMWHKMNIHNIGPSDGIFRKGLRPPHDDGSPSVEVEVVSDIDMETE